MPIHHKVSLVSFAIFLGEGNNLQLSKPVQKEAAAPNVLPLQDRLKLAWQ
jgi:hypothetical protein